MQTIRLAEHGSAPTDLPRETRVAIHDAALGWKNAHKLNKLPLEWGGTDGCTLSARQWVGVVEVEGARVEIYPKLDRALLNGAAPDEAVADSALRALLPMLEAAQYGQWMETGAAALGETDLSFVDVWAFLLGQNLLNELRRGLVAHYQHQRDDLPGVRGKIAISRQVGALFNRMDVIACEWDEFTADTPFNRLLKCACATLKQRVSHPAARALLSDCERRLDEASDVAPAVAVRQTERLIWTRGAQRYRDSFELARRLLRDLSPEIEGGEQNSWAFLVDMNAVFESFCGAALEAKFGVNVETQVNVGTLFRAPNRVHQYADFVWTRDNQTWIGDAKWKLLGDQAPLVDESEVVKAGAIAPADARQLSVYALLLKEQKSLANVPATAILYPTLSENAQSQTLRSWNGANLHIWPIRVRGAASLAQAISIGTDVAQRTLRRRENEDS